MNTCLSEVVELSHTRRILCHLRSQGLSVAGMSNMKREFSFYIFKNDVNTCLWLREVPHEIVSFKLLEMLKQMISDEPVVSDFIINLFNACVTVTNGLTVLCY